MRSDAWVAKETRARHHTAVLLLFTSGKETEKGGWLVIAISFAFMFNPGYLVSWNWAKK